VKKGVPDFVIRKFHFSGFYNPKTSKNRMRYMIFSIKYIARILGAALIVPILQVNVIWRDEK